MRKTVWTIMWRGDAVGAPVECVGRDGSAGVK